MRNVYNIFAHSNDEPLQPVKSYKIGRNDPCPCGSGKKFKTCCNTIKPKHPIDYYVDQLENAHDEEQVLQLLLEAEQDYPMEPSFFLPLTAHFMKNQQEEESLAYLKKAWAVMGTDLHDVYITALVNLMCDNDEYLEAQSLIEDVLEKKKETPFLTIAYCETLKYSDEYDKIFHMLDNALEKYPVHVNLLLCKLQCYLDLDQHVKALRIWSDHFALFKEIEDCPSLLFIRSLLEDTFDLASDAPDEVLQGAINQMIKVFSSLGKIDELFEQEKYADFRKHLEKTRSLIVPSSKINMIILEAYSNLEDYETIIEYSQILEPHFADQFLFYTYYSEALMATGKNDEALQLIERALTLALEEEDFEGWDMLGIYSWIALTQNDPSILARLITRIQNLASKDDTVLNILETTLSDAGYPGWVPKLQQQLKALPESIDPKELYCSILYHLFLQLEKGTLERNPQLLEVARIAIQQEVAAAEAVQIVSPMLHFAKLRTGMIEESAIADELKTLIALPSEYYNEVLSKYEAILLYGDPRIILDHAPDPEMINEAEMDYHRLVANIILGDWAQAQETLLLTLIDMADGHNFYEFLVRLLTYVSKERLMEVIDHLGLSESSTENVKNELEEYCARYEY